MRGAAHGGWEPAQVKETGCGGVGGVDGKLFVSRNGPFPVEGPQGTERGRVVAYVIRIASDARRRESKHYIRQLGGVQREKGRRLAFEGEHPQRRTKDRAVGAHQSFALLSAFLPEALASTLGHLMQVSIGDLDPYYVVLFR